MMIQFTFVVDDIGLDVLIDELNDSFPVGAGESDTVYQRDLLDLFKKHVNHGTLKYAEVTDSTFTQFQ